MNEVLIFSENAVITDGWPDIYYVYDRKKWQATTTVNNKRFYVENCDSSDEAVARIEQAIVDHFGFFERRNKERRSPYDRRAY